MRSVAFGSPLLAVALALLLPPRGAEAHEVLHVVERGRAVAVRVFFADGEPLAHCAYEVFSPADPKIPHQQGRTDGNGNVAFVPDAPGKWRVKVVDAGGHGLDTAIDVGGLAPVAGAAAGGTTGAAFVLRPLVGVAAIAAVFGVLVFLRRRRAPP